MSQEYLQERKINSLPRLPLMCGIDFTYRCNNNCRHCWLRIPVNSAEKNQELSSEEIRKIFNEARKMGCHSWSISGGEPMLRLDFSENFDYITSNSYSYAINTNGTLITPKIAKLLKRKGSKLVALYGATKDVHDHITRNPGSFEATMRGFRYLKEAGAGFTVQLIPMKDNYHQFKEMTRLAESLSTHYRVGVPWLYLCASGDKTRNAEIIRQRLPPKEIVDLDKPDMSYVDGVEEETSCCHSINKNGYLLCSGISAMRDFHIDSYGLMTFCWCIKDSALRYDLKKGSFKDCWENFIPSLSKKIKVTKEYKKNCGSCGYRNDCRICPGYGYLEHRDFNAKVEYLCAVAKENRKFKENWQKNHRRYFKIANITIQIDSDLPITEATFHPKFKLFEIAGPGEDTISIWHHFSLPDLKGKDLGKELYRKSPWAIYQKDNSWIYLGISPSKADKSLQRVVVFNNNYTKARIYNDKEESFLKGNLCSLALFPTDQILLACVLADRQGCYLHASGVIFAGKGLLFAGHSEAGKSTMATMLKGKAEILCDDRIIVRKLPTANRRLPAEFRIYGTWSHGDLPDVSSNSAPLRAIMFLEKADENRIIPLEDKKERTRRLLSYLIKPFVTVEWWEKTLAIIEKISQEVPCYVLRFDKSGKVVDLLEML